MELNFEPQTSECRLAPQADARRGLLVGTWESAFGQKRTFVQSLLSIFQSVNEILLESLRRAIFRVNLQCLLCMTQRDFILLL